MIFLNSASSAAALVFYLPGVCTHTDTEGKQSPEYFKIFEKKTQFLMNTLYVKCLLPDCVDVVLIEVDAPGLTD